MLPAWQLADRNILCTASDSICESFLFCLSERCKDKNSRSESAYLELFNCVVFHSIGIIKHKKEVCMFYKFKPFMRVVIP